MKPHQHFSVMLLFALVFGRPWLHSATAADPLPNVLFLAIDDLNDWVGALGGHPQAKSPNLDRLISRSVVFRNAHCAAPVCSASRHALLSGLRPSTTGWYSNSSKNKKSYEKALGETVPMPTHFKRNGYRTMAAGKIFHKGTSDVKGYDYWDEERPKYTWPTELAARGHGYQGMSGGHFHPFPPDGGAIYQMNQEGVDGQSLCWGALEQADIPPEGMPDEQVAAWAVERLRQKHDKPFFLAVGFVRPHVPYTAPKEFFELYPAGDIVMPSVPADEMDDIPLWGKTLAYGTIEGGDHRAVLDVGPDYWREMVRAYLACVSFVDAQAGKVLDALAASPYDDNTIIVFWSDHGQHLGEKHHWRKMALWEESTRVPLAIRLPKSARSGQKCDQPVSLIDIYPTLVELCNLPNVKGLEGISLMPQLEDPSTQRAEPAVTTWQYNNHAVRSLNFRYIRYRDGTEELYDHRSDPNEHNNLAHDPRFASTKQELGAYLPTNNVVPAAIKDGRTDSYGRKYERLRSEGVPDWLGQVPGEEQQNGDRRLAIVPDEQKMAAKQQLLSRIAPSAVENRKPPNVVLILADDLGYADTGVYGSRTIPTPHIDALARDGMRFTDAYVTAASCSPSRAALMTGRYQQRFGFEFNTSGGAITHRTSRGLDPAAITLADVLRQAGYATGMFGKWHLGTREYFHPQQRGFEEFYGFLAGAHSYFPPEHSEPVYSTVMRGSTPIIEPDYLTDAFARETERFIHEHRDNPFFVYVPFNAVHTPLEAADRYLERFPDETNRRQQAYNAMTSALDHAVGTIMTALSDAELAENTLVVFLNDNGGPIYTGVQSNAPLRLGKLFLFEGGVRVPMIVRWPGRIEPGSVYHQPVSSLDVFPTACAAAGVSLPTEVRLDGVNLLPYLTGQNGSPPHEALFWSNGPNRAIRSGNWKLIMAGEHRFLFNLQNDIGETTNLAEQQPEVVRRLVRDLDKWQSEIPPAAWPSKPNRRKVDIDGVAYELNI